MVCDGAEMTNVKASGCVRAVNRFQYEFVLPVRCRASIGSPDGDFLLAIS